MSRQNTAYLTKLIVEHVSASIDDPSHAERAAQIVARLPEALSTGQNRLGLVDQLVESSKKTNAFTFGELKERLLQALADERTELTTQISTLALEIRPLDAVKGGAAGAALGGVGGFLATGAVDILTGGLASVFGAAFFGASYRTAQKKGHLVIDLERKRQNIIDFADLLRGRSA